MEGSQDLRQSGKNGWGGISDPLQTGWSAQLGGIGGAIALRAWGAGLPSTGLAGLLGADRPGMLWPDPAWHQD